MAALSLREYFCVYMLVEKVLPYVSLCPIMLSRKSNKELLLQRTVNNYPLAQIPANVHTMIEVSAHGYDKGPLVKLFIMWLSLQLGQNSQEASISLQFD